MKRIVSWFLVLVLCGSILSPLTVLAEPVDGGEQGGGEQKKVPFSLVNMSNAGATLLGGYFEPIWYDELEIIQQEAEQSGQPVDPHSNPLAAKATVMVSAMDLEHTTGSGADEPAYFIPYNNMGSYHELTLYGMDDVNVSTIRLTGEGIRTESTIQKHVIGSGEGVRWYYTVRIFVPNTDTVLGVQVDGETVCELPIIHFSNYPSAPLLTTMWVEDYEEDEDLITSLTLRVSGFALGNDPARFALAYTQYEEVDGEMVGNPQQFVAKSISDEDQVGYRLLTFDLGSGISGMDFMGADLIDTKADEENGGNLIFYFGKGDHLKNVGTDPETGEPQYAFNEANLRSGMIPFFGHIYGCINKPAPYVGEAPEVMPELVVLGVTERGDGMPCTQLTHVNVNQNPGSYLDGEWRLSTNGRSWYEWCTVGANQGNTQLPFANSGEYGDYTIYAQFRKEGLRTVTLKRTINYNDGVAPTPQNVGILDTKNKTAVKPNAGGQYVLTGDADKSFTFVAGGYPKMTVNLYFKYHDETEDKLFQTGSVVPMAYNEANKRYEVALKKSEIPEDAVAVYFWTEKADGYQESSAEVYLSMVNQEPALFRPMAPNYAAQRRVDDAGKTIEVVKPGDEIECLLTASAGTGWTREMKMTYTDMDGAAKTLTATPVRYGESKNSYRGVFKIPDDAKQLGKITYTLLLDGDEVDRAEYDLSACCVVADVALKNIPASYQGIRLTLAKGETKRTFVLNGEAELNFGDLTPGAYTWALEGKSGHITGGSFDVTRGCTLTLPALPALGSLTVNTVGVKSTVNGKTILPEAKVNLTLTTPDGVSETLTAAPGAKLEQMPVGTTGTAALTWDTAAYEEISGCTPATASINIQGDDTVTFQFQTFTMRTISGTLYGKRSDMDYRFTPWNTELVLTQNITRGGKTEVFTKTVKITSATGNAFSFQCYDNFPATIEFRSLTWSGDPITVTESGDQKLGKVTLHDGGEKLVQIKVEAALPQAVYLDSEGKVKSTETAKDGVPLDSAFLNISSVRTNKTHGKDDFETLTNDGQLWLKLKEGVVTGNDSIDIDASGAMEYGNLTFNVHGTYTYQPQSARVKDLGNNTGMATFYASMNGGELRATVVEDADSGMTGFLMFFYKSPYSGAVTCYYTCGTGELHLGYTGVGDWQSGLHTVMSLMVRNEDVPAMANVLQSTPEVILNQIPQDKIEKLVMRTRSTKKFCFMENVNLQSNAYVYLEGMTPNVNVGAEILPPYSFDYQVALTEDASTLQVIGTLTKRFPDVINGDAVKGMRVYVVDSNGDVTADATDSVTVNGRHGYSGYFTGFTYHGDVVQFTAPLTKYNDLRFKIVLSIGNNGSTIRDRDLTFTYNDAVPIFSLSGPSAVYIADQLDAQGLAVNAHDKTYDAANWTLRLSLRSFGSNAAEDGPITIWDNGVAIFQKNMGYSAYFWPIEVRLTDNLNPGVHVLWATRKFNGQEISTEPLVISLMDGRQDNAVHVSDLEWVHWNSRTATSSTNGDVMHFKNLSELAGQTIWLWPGKRTDMKFRVNNATTKELKGVSVRFYGVRVRGRNLDNITADIPCKCVYESETEKYSIWKFENQSMGYFYSFEFVFDYQPATLSELSKQSTEEERRVADLEATYQACGLGEVPDVTDEVDALADIKTKDQLKAAMGEVSENLPGALSNLGLKVTKNTSTAYEVALDKPTSTIKDYRLKVNEIAQKPAHEIYALMEKERANGNQNPNEKGWQVCWAELDGIQGSTMIRMAVHNEKKADGTYGLTMHRTVYITSEVAKAIKEGKSVAEASVNLVPRAKPSALYDGGDPPAHWVKQGYDVVSYLNSTGDITQDLYVAAVKDTYKDAAEAAAAGKNAKFMPKHLGDAMNILGVADAAISISSGPSGKDSMGLYMLLSNVKDQKFRAQIESQLRDYDQIRMDIYAQDTAMSAVGAGANFVPDPTPLTKIVCFLGGIGNGIISGWAKDYNRQVYNTTLSDIQRQIRLESYKQMRAEMDVEFKKMVERRFGKDVANNERLLMEEKKHWVLGTDEFGDPKWRLRENVPEYNTYQDPSGYVFEAVEGNRLEGVTATLYFSETVDGTYTVWHDPAADPQSNPLSTNAEGRYQWMVPEGWWKVRYEKDGYLVAESRPMEVPPMHTAVNIGLLSTEAPTAAVKATEGTYTVAFSRYMQLETLIRNAEDYSADSFSAADFAIRFLDENGDPVPGTVTFPDKAMNIGYKGDGYGVDVIPSDWFARNAVFTPDEGHTVKNWSLGKGMLSYAGVALEGETADLYLVHLDAAGGEVSTPDLVTDANGLLAKLPDAYREGYRFLGWYNASGSPVTLATAFTADAVLTARWEVFGGYTVDAVAPEGQGLTVTFKNGTAETDPVTCLTAVYGANGRMLRVESASLTTGTRPMQPATSGGNWLQAFCYDAGWTPVAEAFFLKLESVQ